MCLNDEMINENSYEYVNRNAITDEVKIATKYDNCKYPLYSGCSCTVVVAVI